jgi:hypothetical protein
MATLTQIVEPEWILPFEAMKVGDSFFIPTLRPAELIYSIDCGAKRVGIKVKAYVTAKDEKLGVRAWRIG